MKPTRVRHKVLWLTVIAYMITYMDRVVISATVPMIEQELHLDKVTMGWVLAAFSWGYSLFQIPGGWLGDKIGPRRALALIVTWWSVFTSLTAMAWSAGSMAAFRFLFGMGEAGAFPTATRSLSRWMLPAERAYAQGVTHAGSRLGAAFTPVIVVAIMTTWGWRHAFVSFGALGLIWAAIWYYYYRDTPAEHHSVNQAELDLIHQSLGDPRSRGAQQVPWRRIFSSPTVLLVSAMYFMYGYSLQVYLIWFPTYLNERRGMSLKEMGFYASLPLLAGTLGDLMGGIGSDYLARRTGNLKLARRAVAMLGFLGAAASIVPATLTPDPQTCVAFTCLAVFSIELTVGVSWAIPLDIGADFAGSVSSVMNMCGNIGGAISPALVAYLVTGYGWNEPFLLAAALCAVAALLHLRIDATRKILTVAPAGVPAREG